MTLPSTGRGLLGPCTRLEWWVCPIGTLVSTQKNRKFDGAKLMLVQPLNLDDSPRGNALLAIDGVGAGVDEKVLVVLEGRAAGEALGKKGAPVDAAIVGIIDTVSITED